MERNCLDSPFQGEAVFAGIDDKLFGPFHILTGDVKLLDYGRHRAQFDFNCHLSFPGISSTQSISVPSAITFGGCLGRWVDEVFRREGGAGSVSAQ